MNIKLKLNEIFDNYKLFHYAKELLEAIPENGSLSLLEENYPNIYALLRDKPNIDFDLISILIGTKGNYKVVSYLADLLKVKIHLYSAGGTEIKYMDEDYNVSPTAIEIVKISQLDEYPISDSDYQNLVINLLNTLKDLIWLISDTCNISIDKVNISTRIELPVVTYYRNKIYKEFDVTAQDSLIGL